MASPKNAEHVAIMNKHVKFTLPDREGDGFGYCKGFRV